MNINYIRSEDCFIPDLKLPEETRPIGKWGTYAPGVCCSGIASAWERGLCRRLREAVREELGVAYKLVWSGLKLSGCRFT